MSFFGPSFPELGWVPAPRYLLRRHLVLSCLKGKTPGRVLEIGPAVGALLQELAEKGWTCTGIETSEPARAIALVAARDKPRMAILPQITESLGTFDCLMGFEVLEHIEDDRSALRDWLSYVEHNGIVLLSVPAHQHRWSASDVATGHWRRYSRGEFIKLAEDCDCEVQSVMCYGWPLANLTGRLRAYRDQRVQNASPTFSDEQAGMQRGTNLSGIDRRTEARYFDMYASSIGAAVFRLFLLLQSLTLRTELGNGYLMVARKR